MRILESVESLCYGVQNSKIRKFVGEYSVIFLTRGSLIWMWNVLEWIGTKIDCFTPIAYYFGYWYIVFWLGSEICGE